MTPETRLFAWDGTPIGFDQVPTAGDPGIGLRNTGLAEVQFQADRRHGVVDTLWVLRR